MFHLQIVLVEEKFLLRAFGDEYATYKRRVNRYLGRKSTANCLPLSERIVQL